MKVKGLLIVSLLVVAAMAGLAFYTASLLPEGAQLPNHFDGTGHPDHYTGALPALLMPAGILLLISLTVAAVPYIEPLQERLEASAPLLRVSWIALIALMVFVQATAVARAFGWDVPIQLHMAATGVLFIVLGNWLPKSRPGFFVGIRTPWTITDEDIWIATHRLAGKLMMLCGIVMVVVPFALLRMGQVIATQFVIVAVILMVGVVPAIYSWWLWHRKKKAKQAEG